MSTHIQITAQAVAEAITIERRKSAAEIGRLKEEVAWLTRELNKWAPSGKSVESVDQGKKHE